MAEKEVDKRPGMETSEEQNLNDVGEMKPIEKEMKELREQCKELEQRARDAMNHPVFKGDQAFSGQHSEMKAHTMLAVRHLEDARMRMGKVCQYADDGVSCFDKQ